LSFEPSLKKKIVKEAANLLYVGIEKEYKQAKIKAAKTFRSRTLPTNHAIALELDRISEEREGTERQRNLIKMRRAALKIMKVLRKFNPILIGSVWRGTSNHNSDIDILVYYEDPLKIENIIEKQGYHIFQSKRVSVTKKGINKSAYHIYVKNSNNRIIEIVNNNADEQFIVKKCESFGDKITGLDIKYLEKILKENPAQKFIPI
jgi:predicted nucleotidyltransferase